MKELETIVIDGKDYYILKEKNYNNINYIFLSNVDDASDIMIRKNSSNDMYIPLDDEKEFELACLTLFS